jgi:hypothetical protein
MRKSLRIAAWAMAPVLIAGCANTYHVETMAAPDIRLSAITTFRVLPAPRPQYGHAQAGPYDPMMNNSIANSALRDTITQALVGRGYILNERFADVDVAIYASAHQKLDVTLWDYGYPYWPRSEWSNQHAKRVTEYTEGTVIVDVLLRRSRELVWRGMGTAVLSEDPQADVKELQKAAIAVIKKFPRAERRVVAVAP